MKKFLTQAGFLLVRATVKGITFRDAAARKEINAWPEGFSVGMRVFQQPASIALQVKNGKLVDATRQLDNPDLIVFIKSYSLAAKIILGRISMAEAYSQNRIYVEGNISQTMRFVRVMNRLMAHLLPPFLLKKNKEHPPK